MPNDPPAPALGAIREQLGIQVRHVWIAWAMEQPSPKASWLTSWEYLSEAEREVDRRIGEALYRAGLDAQAARLAAATAALTWARDTMRMEIRQGGAIMTEWQEWLEDQVLPALETQPAPTAPAGEPT